MLGEPADGEAQVRATGVALIADIVGSRRLADRGGTQRAIMDTIDDVQREVSVAVRPLRPTVGDEFQGTFSRIEDAVETTLLLQLWLPEGVEFRFGIGVGALTELAMQSSDDVVTDGSGWWAARAAITEVAERQVLVMPSARTGVAFADSEGEISTVPVVAWNAYVALRDELVGAMAPRVRRVVRSRIRGISQAEIAREEGITQSAVSQLLRRSGAAALLHGLSGL